MMVGAQGQKMDIDLSDNYVTVEIFTHLDITFSLKIRQ
jgi:hypothetical protein